MKTRLTKSEMEIMEVLWDAGKALTTSEIIQRSKEKESNLEMIEFIQKLLEERKEEIKVKQK